MLSGESINHERYSLREGSRLRSHARAAEPRKSGPERTAKCFSGKWGNIVVFPDKLHFRIIHHDKIPFWKRSGKNKAQLVVNNPNIDKLGSADFPEFQCVILFMEYTFYVTTFLNQVHTVKILTESF